MSPYPGAAQLIWGQLLQLIPSSLEEQEQGGCLAAATLPLSQQKARKSWQRKAPQDTLTCCPLFLLMWSLKRVLGA